MCVTFLWMGVDGCEWVWMGVGGCDLFVGGCEWV